MRSKPELFFRDTYLAAIRNSVGSRMFRSAFFRIGRSKSDIADGGRLSCALFVSSLLKIFGLIGEVHTTVSGAVADLEKSGWRRIRSPKPGCVLVWEAKRFGDGEHGHIGFYLGGGQAVSNSSRGRAVAQHHWTFGVRGGRPARRVEAIYRHRKLGAGY